jgi:hypothetical protein
MNTLRTGIYRPYTVSHPRSSVIFRWPREEAAREILFWDIPLCAISILLQPSVNLLGSLVMVNFGYDERPLILEKICAAIEDFVLAAFHVNLD